MKEKEAHWYDLFMGGQSYGEIAFAFGATKGKVAGEIYRHRKATGLPGRPRSYIAVNAITVRAARKKEGRNPATSFRTAKKETHKSKNPGTWDEITDKNGWLSRLAML